MTVHGEIAEGWGWGDPAELEQREAQERHRIKSRPKLSRREQKAVDRKKAAAESLVSFLLKTEGLKKALAEAGNSRPPGQTQADQEFRDEGGESGGGRGQQKGPNASLGTNQFAAYFPVTVDRKSVV